MANIKSAKKRARQAETRRERNASQRSEMRTHIKNLLKIIEKGDLAEANATLRKTASVLDKSAKRGLIHKNKASRTKSRLNARVKKLIKK